MAEVVKIELTEKELDRTPYWQQGNLIYYSEDMIVARMRHLDSKKINEAINLWLKVIPKHHMGTQIGPGGVVHHAQIFIPKEAYITMASKISRSLRPGLDEETILAEAEEDWLEDSDNGKIMNECATGRLIDLFLPCGACFLWPWLGLWHGGLVGAPQRNGSQKTECASAVSLLPFPLSAGPSSAMRSSSWPTCGPTPSTATTTASALLRASVLSAWLQDAL